MGFGFFLLLLFIVGPSTIILILIGLFTRDKDYFIAIGVIWFLLFGLICLSISINFFTSKKNLDQSDLYGDYVIDRSHFPGKQADWQYDHFRFTLTHSDSIYFHETEGANIIKTHKGSIRFLTKYSQPRLIIEMENDTCHHIIEKYPTLYRKVWSFYYVFHSPKFKNVFFRKGKWRKR